MKFLTIKDAAELTAKSESTIKRFVRETKKKHPKKYSSSKNFKFEKLPTGHKKVLISESFLAGTYPIVKGGRFNGSNEPLNEPLKESDNQDYINFLKEQIREKDKQIDTLLERNREINILFANSQKQSLQLEEDTTKKKRWWQRR